MNIFSHDPNMHFTLHFEVDTYLFLTPNQSATYGGYIGFLGFAQRVESDLFSDFIQLPNISRADY